MNRRNIVKFSGLYTIMQGMDYLLGFAFAVVATRLLGIESYGVYLLGYSVFSTVCLLGLFGLDFCAQKTLSGFFSAEHRLRFGTMIAIGSGAAAAGALVLLAGNSIFARTWFHQPGLERVLTILGAALLFFLPLQIVLSLFKAQHRAGAVIGLNVCSGLTKLLGLIPIRLMDDKLTGISLVILVSSAATSLLSVVVLRSYDMLPSFGNLRRRIPDTLARSVVFFLTGFAYYAVPHADRMMIGMLSTAEAVGVHGIASLLAMIPGVFHSSILTVFMPAVSDLHARRGMCDELRETYRFANMLGIVMGVPCILAAAILGEPVLKIVFGAGTPAYYVLWLLLVRLLLHVFIGPVGTLLTMTNGQRLECWNGILHLGACVALSWLLIPEFSAVGAATANLVSIAAVHAIGIWQVRWRGGFLVVTWRHVFLLVVTGIPLIGHILFMRGLSLLHQAAYLALVELLFFSGFWVTLCRIDRDKIRGGLTRMLAKAA